MNCTAAYSVKLNMPRDRAWEKLSDLSLAPCYVPGVNGMEFTTRRTEGVGTARLVFPQKMKEEVSIWEPGSEIELRLTKRGSERFFPFRKSLFRYSLYETGSTFIKLSLEYEPMMGRFGYFLFGGIIRKRIRRTAESLKKFYETS